MRQTCFASVIALTFAVAAASADEIPNPEFARWSKFEKGTSVTQTSVSKFGNWTFESTQTVTLIEVGAEKLVLEGSCSGKINGVAFEEQRGKVEVTKAVTPTEPMKSGGVKVEVSGSAIVISGSLSLSKPKTEKPSGKREEGTETLTVGGIDLKTKWVKYESEVEGVKTVEKVWTSEDVPTTVVKSEKVTTSGAFASEYKMELVEFKKP